MSDTARLQPAGTLLDDALYIERSADVELLRALEAGEPCFLLAPRQIGKSSLRVRTAQKLRARGLRVATVDLTRIGGAESTLAGWYYGVVQELWSRLRLEGDPADFWQLHANATPLRRWVLFLRDRVLPASSAPLVIFVDEIDTVLSLPFSSDDFFASLRDTVNLRAEEPAYRRLTFCMLGVAAPGDLMHDAARTPFNVGRQIALTDFSSEEARALLPVLAGFTRDPDELLSRVMDWSAGHPYMTMRLCQELQSRAAEQPGFDALAAVEPLVRELFLLQGRAEDPNLSYAERRLLASPRATDLLRLYARVRSGEPVPADREDPLQLELRLTGLTARRTRGDKAELVVRNRICAEVFDAAWVRGVEAERLLAKPLAQWLSSNRSDDAVLRGAPLEEALRWAQGRQGLSPDESSFLMAGLSVARREEAAHREAERDHTAATVLRRTVAGVGLLAIGLFVALGFAIRATREARTATLRERAALALALAGVPGRELEAVRAGLEAAAPALEAGDLPPESAYTGLATAVGAAAPWPLLIMPPVAMGPAALSADGSRFAAAAEDGRIFVWDLGKPERERIFRSDRISCSTPSPDGKWLARTSVDRLLHTTLEVLDLSTGQVAMRLPDANCASWAPSGTRLAITQSSSATVVEFPSGRSLLLDVDAAVKEGLSPRFSPDGGLVVGRTRDRKTLLLWDAGTRGVLYRKPFDAPFTDYAFASGGRDLLVLLRDGTLLRLEARTGEELSRTPGTPASYGNGFIEVAPDGRQAVMFNGAGPVLADLEGSARTPLAAAPVPFISAAFTPDGRLLAASQEGERLFLYDAATGQAIERLPLDAEDTDLAFTRDGRSLLVSDTAGHLHILPLGLQPPTRTLALGGPPRWLAVSSRGARVVGASGGRAHLFDGATGAELESIAERGPARGSSAISPDESTLLLHVPDRGFTARNIGPGPARALWETPSGGSAAFSPDGESIWLALSFSELRQVVASTGRALQTLHSAYQVNSVVTPEVELAVSETGLLYIATGTALLTFHSGDTQAKQLSGRPVQRVLPASDPRLLWLTSSDLGAWAADPGDGDPRALFGAGLVGMPSRDGAEALWLPLGTALGASPHALLRRSVSLSALASRACELLEVRDPQGSAARTCAERLKF